jgi:hypothetical protein
LAFLRFVVSTIDTDSGRASGVFQLAVQLKDSALLSDHDRQVLHDELAWFNEHLTEPARFNRSKSKGSYRRKTRGISWFRDTATECLSRMHELKRILEINGHPVTIIREARVGFIIYEDDHQVVAEPFADTRTGA